MLREYNYIYFIYPDCRRYHIKISNLVLLTFSLSWKLLLEPVCNIKMSLRMDHWTKLHHLPQNTNTNTNTNVNTNTNTNTSASSLCEMWGNNLSKSSGGNYPKSITTAVSLKLELHQIISYEWMFHINWFVQKELHWYLVWWIFSKCNS